MQHKQEAWKIFLKDIKDNNDQCLSDMNFTKMRGDALKSVSDYIPALLNGK